MSGMAFMKVSARLRIVMCGLSAVLLACGCDGDYKYVYADDNVIVESSCCVTEYRLQVIVADAQGNRLPGASVELTVASFPEQNYAATTDSGGVATFEFFSDPFVSVVAYACYPGLGCEFSDATTPSGRNDFFMSVTL